MGTAAAQLVAPYWTGILKRLPDPPVGPFDSEKVDTFDYADRRLQTPDAFLILGTYAATGAPVAAGRRGRATEQPWLSVAVAAKVDYDVVTNLTLAREEWGENRALCAYCRAASVASVASLALVPPEAARGAAPGSGLSGYRGAGGADAGAAGDPAHDARRCGSSG